MKKIVNPTIVHSATQPSERADLWIKALPNNQNTLMIFDNGYENVDSNLTERLNNEAQERQSSDEELDNKISQETTNRVNSDNNLNSKITTNLNAINTINSKIPTQASSTNQLADKDFVNSSIANDTATFQGTFESVANLPTTNVKKNDYAFVITEVEGGNPEYKRYKYNGTQWIEEFVLNNSSFTANQWAAINSGVTEDWINETTEALKSAGGSITEITWSELKTKRDAGELTPGVFYRITDYQCTTVQANTRSAGNQFDIIVLALTNNTLSEQAYAALHSEDTYFANSNLSAWKLWYCLDNDTTRFAWADNTSGNGRGVIYRMIDEFNNDVPYDFKNIQCTDSSGTLSGYFYTFNFPDSNSDATLVANSRIFNNYLGPAKMNNTEQYIINCTIFIRHKVYNNNFIRVKNSTFYSSYSAISNNFIFLFENNKIFNSFYQNHSYNSFSNNNITGNFFENTIKGVFTNNKINLNFTGNTILRNFRLSTIKADFNYNTIIICSELITEYPLLYNIFYNCNCIKIQYSEVGENNKDIQNYIFTSGLSGTSSSLLTISLDSGRTYETKVGLNSSGEVKQWCEADLVQ